MNALIRPAREGDAAAFAAIYAPYTATPLTFEAHAPTVEEFAGRIRAVTEAYPWLTAQADGRVLGYAYAHRLREREAYDWEAELSVYLSRDCTGQGVGTALYTRLLELLAQQNVATAWACLVPPNPPSEALHRKCGFSPAGRWLSVGWKCGEWHDLLWYRRQLLPPGEPPRVFIPYPKIMQMQSKR